MAELTRDEAKRACEAVHWKTTETGGGFMVSTPFGWCGWKALFRVEVAMALLEATGCSFKIHFVPEREDDPWWVAWDVPWPGRPDWIPGATLPSAAVRAVLAWKEARDA